MAKKKKKSKFGSPPHKPQISVGEQSHAQEKQDHNQSSPTIASNTQPAPHNPDKPQPSGKTAIPWRILEGIGIAAGIGYAIVSLLMWRAMLDANKLTRQALEVSQRAYVSFTGLGDGIKNTSPTGEVYGELFPIEWENSGTTPVSGGKMEIGHAEKAFGDDLPNGFHYPPDKSGVKDAIISPKGTTAVDFNIRTEDLMKIQDRKVHWFIWGSFVYRDIFPDTPTHLDEFCVDIYAITHRDGGGPPKFKSPISEIVPKYGYCKEHNCYDERCPDYKKMTK